MLLHGVNFDFNTILIQVIRGLGFQYWANFVTSSNPFFRRRIFITSRWHILSSLSSMSISIPVHNMVCHSVHEKFFSFTQHLRQLYSLECPLGDFRISCYDVATGLPVLERGSEVGFVKMKRHWVTFETPIRHSSPQRISPHWKTKTI